MHITLTDEEDVPEAVGKLRVIYPNLMKLDYDNRRTRSQAEPEAPEETEEKMPMELFADFYQMQNQQPMTEEQKAFAGRLMAQIWEEKE